MDWSSPTTQIVFGFGLSLAVGMLVGLERERHASEEKRPGFAGIRTFPMIAMAGSISGLLSQAWGPLAMVPAFFGLTALVGMSYWTERKREDGPDPGLTSEIAALLVFAIGALPFVTQIGLDFQQRSILAGALGTIVMVLLSLKETLHKAAGKVSREDLTATARFLLLAAVVLPLLPDQAYGPFDTLNPFTIGVVVVMIAGISFVGYLAVRFLGARKGIGLTALFGGLASSTAVALTFSARGKENPKLALMCAFAIIFASTVMFPRIAIELAAFNQELVVPMLAPLGAMLVAGVIGAGVLWQLSKTKEKDGEEPKFANPFKLSQALKLGAVYAAVRLVSAAAHHYWGDSGLYASAILAGLADVDAITISVARLHGEGEQLATHTAVFAITLAAISNTMVKAGIALVLGGWKVGLAVAAVLVPAAIAGLIVALVV
jgi:uncharacterized membrane protein (DUF4010 family)